MTAVIILISLVILHAPRDPYYAQRVRADDKRRMRERFTLWVAGLIIMTVIALVVWMTKV